MTFTAIDPLTNCQKTFTKNIGIKALPTLSFVGLQDKYCIETQPFALNAQPIGGSFSVNGNAVVGMFNPKNYQVGNILVVKYSFIDNNGCDNSISSYLEIMANCDTRLILPTAFTPNGDGLNDVFEIKGSDFSFLNIQIYNRWGEIVFISRAKNDNWDGTFMGKPCPEGVYVWKAKYKDRLGKEEKIEGKITLIR